MYDELDASGRVVATLHAPLTLRYVFRYEMDHLLVRAGFHVDALFGDFRRGPFRAGGEQNLDRAPIADAGASAAE